MALLDGLTGGGNNGSTDSSNTNASSNEHSFDAATSPAFALSTSDILHSLSGENSTDGGNGSGNGSSDSSAHDFTGLGNLTTAFAAPTTLSFDHSQDQFNSSETHDNGGGGSGGLLHGLA